MNILKHLVNLKSVMLGDGKPGMSAGVVKFIWEEVTVEIVIKVENSSEIVLCSLLLENTATHFSINYLIN